MSGRAGDASVLRAKRARRLTALILVCLALLGLVAYRQNAIPLPDTSALEPVEIIDNPVRTPVVGISFGAPPLGYTDAEITRLMDLAASVGVGWIRLDLDWSQVEAQEGTYDWSVVDRAVRLSLERDIQVLGMLAYTPDWARPQETTDKHPPSNNLAFSAFTAAAVERYGAQGSLPGLGSTITHWEIWNEPNITGFWEPGADPARYASLFNAAGTAIRTADPEATILTGGLAPADDSDDELSGSSFLRAFLEAGGDQALFDAIAVHPYTYPALPGETQSWNSWHRIGLIRQVLRDFAVNPSLRIWITEYGAPTGGRGSVSLDRQADLIGTALGCAAENRSFGPVFLYTLEDLDSEGPSTEDHFGMLTSDGKAKPVWETVMGITSATTDPMPCGGA